RLRARGVRCGVRQAGCRRRDGCCRTGYVDQDRACATRAVAARHRAQGIAQPARDTCAARRQTGRTFRRGQQMKTWVLLLILLLVACAAAFGWQWLALDPGAVSIRAGEWHIDTTLAFAVVALLVFWGLLGWLARLLRWPLRAWSRRSRRRGRERVASGLTALAEGDHRRALREFERASHHAELRAPALLATARAAHARGEDARAQAALDDAAKDAPAAALTLRTRFLLERGKPEEALALLKPE